jgi:hypothetical protein
MIYATAFAIGATIGLLAAALAAAAGLRLVRRARRCS